jgi:hypothetical protein
MSNNSGNDLVCGRTNGAEDGTILVGQPKENTTPFSQDFVFQASFVDQVPPNPVDGIRGLGAGPGLRGGRGVLGIGGNGGVGLEGRGLRGALASRPQPRLVMPEYLARAITIAVASAFGATEPSAFWGPRAAKDRYLPAETSNQRASRAYQTANLGSSAHRKAPLAFLAGPRRGKACAVTLPEGLELGGCPTQALVSSVSLRGGRPVSPGLRRICNTLSRVLVRGFRQRPPQVGPCRDPA